MRYDLSDEQEARNFATRAEALKRRGCVVELTEKRGRSNNQNSYLHLILAYLAIQFGYTLDYVKREYYKKHCNPDIFIRERDDQLLGRIHCLRSSADLSKEEMSLSIDRFRNWAATEAGVNLPDPDNEEQKREAQRDVYKCRAYL